MSELSEEQISTYVGRCPELTRWAFEGWLRGERHLDGDLIERGDGCAEDDIDRGGDELEWRRVRVWFNEHAIADSTVEVSLAARLEASHRKQFKRLRVTNDPATSPER